MSEASAHAVAGLSAGARVALLAGSGSSVFGIFDTAVERDSAALTVRALGLRLWRAETLATMPEPMLA